MINPQFVKQIAANISYWQQVTANLSDTTMAKIDREKQNLFRAVSFGLIPDETILATIELIIALFPLVERRVYWQEWLPILDQTLNRCPNNQAQLKIQLLNQIGFLRRLARQFPESIAALEQAVSLAKIGKNEEELATAYFFLGNVYYDDAQHRLSENFLQKAQAAFAATGLLQDDKKQAAVHNLIGLNAQSQGAHSTAIEAFEKAISHWKKTGERIYLCRTWNNLGLSYLALGEFTAALDCFQEAELVLTSTVSTDERIRIAINRGQAYYDQKQWAEAEACFRQAEAYLQEQRGSLFHNALIYNNLAAVLLERNCLKEAHDYGQKSRDLWHSLGNKLMAANALGVLGEIAETQGNLASARQSYQIALKQLAPFETNPWANQRRQELRRKLNRLNDER
ncbi:MAG: tetratricopeptide repeat protein [Anaerolineales bacterium]|nr:tetratricopeptide repeat protein [Anaerolineales bacterium]